VVREPTSPSSPIEWEFNDRPAASWIEALLRDSVADEASYGGVNLDQSRRTVTCQGQHVALSQIDFELLLVLARNKNRLVSYSRIYRRLWGPDSKVSVRRLRVHVFRLRKRLDEQGVDGIHIVNRCGVGYMLEIDILALRSATRLRGFGIGSGSGIVMAPQVERGRKFSTATE